MSSSSSKLAYQMSIVLMSANLGHRLPVRRHRRRVAVRAVGLANPLLRAAIVKLAAMRFTSYSNGPGRVSSKSFRSNSSCRSGEANTPKFDRCASPHSCDAQPGRRRVLEVRGHDLRRAPVERERRDHHPAVANGHEIGLAGGVLLPRSSATGSGRSPAGRQPAWLRGHDLLACRLAASAPLLEGRVCDHVSIRLTVRSSAM